jgi:cobalt/nickel transport system ATP-binding protein
MVSAIRLRASAIGPHGRPPVLSGVHLDVAEGERVAVIGANGAGKTTLLKTLVGLLPLPGGGLEVRGRPIREAEDAVCAGIGLVFQNPDDQLFAATVAEDVAFGPRNLGLDERTVQARVDEALSRFSLAALAHRSIDTLSFGEKKRACLAGVLAMRPRLLLLDEPTAGLDPLGEAELLAHLRDLPVTLVCATHAMDAVPRLAERVIVLGGGRVLADGPARRVLTDENLLETARLRPPVVTELGRKLGWAPYPLTVDDAREAWIARRS